MDARTVGFPARVDDVDIGKCILFNVNFSAQIGVIVSINQTAKGILHFDAERNNFVFPTIYDIDSFYNQKCIVIDSARIVPVLSSEHVGFGRFARTVSQALYITEECATITAFINNSVLPVDLLTGRPNYMDATNSIYTRAWYIEVIAADGSYEPYQEFRCEPAS